jgi:hypothetical protein
VEFYVYILQKGKTAAAALAFVLLQAAAVAFDRSKLVGEANRLGCNIFFVICCLWKE